MAVYTHGQHDSVVRSHRWRTAENSAGYLIPHLRTGATVLDLGCGSGSITADLAALVTPGRTIATDLSPQALAHARSIVADRGLTTVDFALADVLSLPYSEGAVDVVHAHQVLQHLADPVAALREMRRVCRRGGIVAVRDADYEAMTWYPAARALDEWLMLYRTVARRNGGEPDAGRRLLSWARQAGFTDVICSASVWCFATTADREYWGGTWADRTTQSAIAEQAVSYGYATRDDLARIADGWRAWAHAPDGWFAVLHSEILCRV
jgi:ubiquinone/menaquinone biosynthesis C-methylase UbiE